MKKSPTAIIRERRITVDDARLTPVTIRLIGKAIKDGSSYIPIRNYAASLAAPAPRKNYLEQLKRVWNGFCRRWRYVRDPFETETVTTAPPAIAQVVLGLNGGAGPTKYGVGDCDDAAVGLGSMLRSIGYPVRIATTAPMGHPGVGFNHVFVQAHVPGRGWLTMDPVLLPHKGLGQVAPNGRMGIWDLNGNLIAARGVPVRAVKAAFKMQRR